MTLPYKLLASVLSLAIFIAAIFGYGKWQYHKGVESTTQKMHAKTAVVEAKSPEITTRVVTKYVDRIKVVREKGAEIIKRVPVYVTKEDDSHCVINTGFVRLWNAANKMQFPNSASIVNETPSPVVLTDVAAQHAKEARLYHETAEQLTALQDWVTQQQKLYEGSDNGR